MASLFDGCDYHMRRLPPESQGPRMDCIGCYTAGRLSTEGIRDMVNVHLVIINLLLQESRNAAGHIVDLLDRVSELESRQV